MLTKTEAGINTYIVDKETNMRYIKTEVIVDEETIFPQSKGWMYEHSRNFCGIPAICRYCKYMSEDNGKKAMLFIAGDRVDDDDLSFFGTAGRRIRADESAVWNVDLSDGCTAF